jgi:hypothetical protein
MCTGIVILKKFHLNVISNYHLVIMQVSLYNILVYVTEMYTNILGKMLPVTRMGG